MLEDASDSSFCDPRGCRAAAAAAGRRRRPAGGVILAVCCSYSYCNLSQFTSPSDILPGPFQQPERARSVVRHELASCPSSFSDAEAGEFLPSTARRRAMGREEGQPQARAHDGGTRREGRGKKEKTG